MEKDSRIYVAGHNGLVGTAIVDSLKKKGFSNIISRKSSELDLTNQANVISLFETEKPEYVFMAAAKVGGIVANSTFPADFIYKNTIIQSNIIHQSYIAGVKKLLFLGSSCIYPKHAPQPLKEEYLLTGLLEPTNEAYAIAKINGIKMCDAYRAQYGCNFISVMPTNLYGTNDNFDLNTSHVLPALLRKFHEAKSAGEKEVHLWGTGTPLREFLHADDLADACVHLMLNYSEPGIINIGSGREISIFALAKLIMEVVGYSGEIKYDTEKPDGTMRKILDTSKLDQLGWKPRIELEDGIRKVYQEKFQ